MRSTQLTLFFDKLVLLFDLASVETYPYPKSQYSPAPLESDIAGSDISFPCVDLCQMVFDYLSSR